MTVERLTAVEAGVLSTSEQPVKRIPGPAWLEVDLDKVANNIRKLKAAAGEGVKLLAMVKAQGYGCGAEMVSKTAVESGADMLGVARVEEAVSLRRCGLFCPILVFGRPEESELQAVVDEDLIQTVFDMPFARELNSVARDRGKTVKVHVKVDTGMGRLGLLPEELNEFLEGFAACSNLILDGVYTHCPSADCDRRFTKEQLDAFREVVEKVKSVAGGVRLIHMANSAALLNRFCDTFDVVRPGISIYGLYGSPLVKREICLEEAVSFKAKVVHVKKIPSGSSVSYGREFVAPRETTIATIAAGYADGVPFRCANKGRVLIHGRRFPIAGRVTMDMTMVDLGDYGGVRVGDEAVIIGQSGEACISVAEVAEKAGTIEHEVICGIGPRVPRVYLRNGRIISVQTYTLG